MFNPNELILENVRCVEEYDLSTGELIARYTQIEEPSLKTAANGTVVTDAMGAEIVTFYNAQTGTFSFNNSIQSLDLMASQFGSKKEVADDSSKITVPVSEIIKIDSDGKAVLKYTPVGTSGAEIKTVKVINEDNTFGATFEISATAGDGKFTLDADKKTIILPSGTVGDIFVNYYRESSTAVKVSKTTDSLPEIKRLLVYCVFHNKCNTNLLYDGVIVCPRAQIDPSSVELSLKADGKHAATYKLQKNYCDRNGKLFEIVVSED